MKTTNTVALTCSLIVQRAIWCSHVGFSSGLTTNGFGWRFSLFFMRHFCCVRIQLFVFRANAVRCTLFLLLAFVIVASISISFVLFHTKALRSTSRFWYGVCSIFFSSIKCQVFCCFHRTLAVNIHILNVAAQRKKQKKLDLMQCKLWQIPNDGTMLIRVLFFFLSVAQIYERAHSRT